MKIKNILLSALMVGTLASCDLDEQYYSETTVDNFVETEDNINQMITRVFAHWRYVVCSYMVTVNEQSADCFVWPARSTGDGWDGSDRPNMRNHTMTEMDGWADTGWKEPLQGVARCIDVMEKLEAINYSSIGLTEEDKAAHMGQMQALMGFFYMVGMDWYGGLPIYSSTQDPLLPRSTVKETFDFTEQLFKDALDGLPVRQNLNSQVDGYLTKGAAAMLLARLYFNANSYIGVEMFDQAAQLCQDVIDGKYGPYQLENDWQAVFNFDNNYSSEIIWGVPGDWNYVKNNWFMNDYYPYNVYKYLGITTGFSTWCYNGLCMTPSRDPQDRLYKETNPEIKLGSPYEKFDDGDLRKKLYRYKGNGEYEGMFLIGELSDPEHPERVCDYYRTFRQGQPEVIYDHIAPLSRLRSNLTDAEIAQLESQGKTLYNSTAEMPSTFYDCADEGDGVRLVKYPIPDQAEYKLYGSQAMPHLRLTETYYMLAECKLRKGDAQGAADLINAVRKRNFEGGADPNPATASNLDKYRMLDEWLIEFIGEGRRRTDLIRWGAFHTEPWWDHTPTNDPNVCRMPLGDSVLGSNNYLKQNPGYGGDELSADEI